MNRLTPLFLLTLCLTTPASADSIRRIGTPDYRNDHRNNFRDDDYEIEGTTKNQAGETIRMKTEHEEDRYGYTHETTITGPDGLIERKKIEVERDGDEVKRKVTTKNADGNIDIQRQEFKIDD